MAEICARCGNPIDLDDMTFIQEGNRSLPVHFDCPTLTRTPEAPTEGLSKKRPRDQPFTWSTGTRRRRLYEIIKKPAPSPAPPTPEIIGKKRTARDVIESRPIAQPRVKRTSRGIQEFREDTELDEIYRTVKLNSALEHNEINATDIDFPLRVFFKYISNMLHEYKIISTADALIVGPYQIMDILFHILEIYHSLDYVSVLVKVNTTNGYFIHNFRRLGIIYVNDGVTEDEHYIELMKRFMDEFYKTWEKWMNRSGEDGEYTLGSIQDVIFGVYIHEGGGCSKNLLKNVQIAGIKCYSVQSTNNECLINSICFSIGKTNTAQTISKQVRLWCEAQGYDYPAKGSLIEPGYCKYLAEFFHVPIKVYGSDGIEIGFFDCVSQAYPTIELFLYDKHYYIPNKNTYYCTVCEKRYQRAHICTDNAKKCERCGKIYKLKHLKCSQSKLKYRNNKANGLHSSKEFVTPKNIFYNSASKWYERVIVFDFETMVIQDEESPYHQVYAAACYNCNDQTYHQWYGPTSLENFFDYVEDLTANNKRKYVLVGQNIFAFDNTFLIWECINRNISFNFILKGSKIIRLETIYFTVADIYAFTGMSLDRAAKEFNCPTDISKDTFPHLFMDSWDKLHYVGPAPDAKYWPKGEIPDKFLPTSLNPEDIEEATFNLKKVCLEYLKKDVMCTEFIMKKVGEVFMQKFNIRFIDFMTVSQTAYEIWTNTIAPPQSDYDIPDNLRSLQTYYIEIPAPEKYQFIRQAVYGGRTFPIKRRFESIHLNKILNGEMKYEDVKEDYIYAFDICSLYACSMKKYEYPIGKSTWCTNIEYINQLIQRKEYDKIPMGIYEIIYIPYSELIMPVLPHKQFELDKKIKYDVKSKGGLRWTLEQNKGIYTSIDIINALKRKYKITVLKGLIWERKHKIFSEYIKITENLKYEAEREGNKTLRAMAKILGNGLYGKNLQIPVEYRHDYVKTKEELDEIMTCYTVDDYIPLGEDKGMLVKSIEPNMEEIINKPSQNAPFILAYSRKIVEKYLDFFDPDRLTYSTASLNNSPYYMDTDSFYIRIKNEEHLESLKNKVSKKDPNKIKQIIGNQFGQIKNDLEDDGKIIEAFFLSPKCYAVRVIDKYNKIYWKFKCKGIPKEVLNIEIYKECFYEGKKKEFQFPNRLKNTGFGEEPFKIKGWKLNRSIRVPPSENRQYIDNENTSESYPIGFEKLNENEMNAIELITNLDEYLIN